MEWGVSRRLLTGNVKSSSEPVGSLLRTGQCDQHVLVIAYGPYKQLPLHRE